MDVADASRPGGKPHPGARRYLGVAVALLVITAVEVAIFTCRRCGP